MSKKTSGSNKGDVLRFLSYLGLVISALVFILGGVLNLCHLEAVSVLLSKISSIVLLIAVAWPAWDYCKSKAKWVKILYFIALVLYILGLVFGFLNI